MENVNDNTAIESGSVVPTITSEMGETFVPLDERLAALGETLGEIRAYDSQIELAEIAGTRTVKFLYQVNKKTGTKVAENSYSRIPTAHLTSAVVVDNAEKLAPYVLAFLQEHEAAMLKDEHRKGLVSIYTPGLSLDKIVARLETLELGSRVTKEIIVAWFVAEMQAKLTHLFMDQMGIDMEVVSAEQTAKLESIVLAYRSKFETLAGGKASIKPADCLAMISMIVKCGAETSTLGVRFTARLEKMAVIVEDILPTL